MIDGSGDGDGDLIVDYGVGDCKDVYNNILLLMGGQVQVVVNMMIV